MVSNALRRPSWVGRVLGLTLAVMAAADSAHAGYTVPAEFVDEPVVGGLDQPVNLALLPDGRTLIIERVPARVRLVVDGAYAAVDPILVVDSVQTNDWERGLLGIAVDSEWPQRPYVYLSYSHLGGPWMRIARFRATGDVAGGGDGQILLDPASRHDIVSHIPDVNLVHNGGSLHFGPDGMLYAAVGDDNVPCDALNLAVLRGKILRLDVRSIPDGPGGNPAAALITPPDNPYVAHASINARLVWAYGLRNPYSFAIDRSTGAMLIADVGAIDFEEIDHAPIGGLNFQWPIYEGPKRKVISCALVDSSQWTPPVYSYGRSVGSTIIAGVVYRRPAGADWGFPLDHEGSFFLTDFYAGFLRRIVPGPGHEWGEAPPVVGQPGPLDWGQGRLWVSAFAQAPDGSLLYVQNWTAYPQPDGQLRRIRRVAVTSTGDGPPSGPAATLAPPSPNPSRAAVSLSFVLARPGQVNLTLLDVRGRRVRSLVAGVHSAGLHRVDWDGRDERGTRVPAGAYRLRLESPGGTVVERTLVRLGAGSATTHSSLPLDPG